MFSPVLGGYLAEFPFGFLFNTCRAWLLYDPEARTLSLVTSDRPRQNLPTYGMDGVDGFSV